MSDVPEHDDRPGYKPQEIEQRWQERWAADGLDHADHDTERPKHYALTMLPYPSGDLHIGHWYAMTPSDARARFMRMRGFNVLFPMGFDAFGLPAENAAIKRDIHPKTWTFDNIERMRGQLKRMGAMIDWRREAISADPAYYHWTEWFFLQLLTNDLAYRKKSPVDWCPSCNTTLAREQVWGDDRVCERCSTPVIKRSLAQWFFRTTRYAEELLDFDGLDWPERVQTLQTHWIGRSEGATVTFRTESGETFDIFTTRPDTLWGVTFMVFAPEHPLVDGVTTPAQRAAVDAYVATIARHTDVQREAVDRDKTGVFTGGYAINPVNGERVPIWIADYVLMTYGTGAIMAVPAHDQRDFDFARRYDLEVRPVIHPAGAERPSGETMDAAILAPGTMIRSGPIDGVATADAVGRTIEHLEASGHGTKTISYRLRDWLISRQRYWGAPIPIVYCQRCGAVPVPETDLPVLLPDDVEWRPTGESPLGLDEHWKRTPCPKCGEEATRETDTMDTFMCSAWYHLRYLSPRFDQGPFDPEEYRAWMPVDTYTGGIEHATMHLIYTRFFHKACRDIGIVDGDEPMIQLRNQGIILGEDSEKMSKTRGNVVAPDALVDRYGADAVRAFLMFFARWEQGGPWNSRGIEGTSRWLRRVWTAFAASPEPVGAVDEASERQLRRRLHRTLRSVTTDFERFQFNTIVASLMELCNDIYKLRDGVGEAVWRETRDIYLAMLAPIAPHLAEELWALSSTASDNGSIHLQPWPEVDDEAAKRERVTLVIQVNGKVRDKVTVEADIDDDEARQQALASADAQRFYAGKTVRKVIVVPGKLVNIVAS